MNNRQFLKTHTQAAHANAERRWVGPNGFRDRTAYDTWLCAMMDKHARLGARAAAQMHRMDVAVREERRISALATDLGRAPCESADTVDHRRSWAWGVQYVLNGSAVGASILLKSRSIKEDWPTAYLREMQDFATSGSLSDFFRRLDTVSLDRTEALSGALEVFS